MRVVVCGGMCVTNHQTISTERNIMLARGIDNGTY